MILETLTGLAFGHLTLAFITIVAGAILLAGIFQLGKTLLLVVLNADHEDAPDFNWSNVVWDKFRASPVFISAENYIVLLKGKYYVKRGDRRYESNFDVNSHWVIEVGDKWEDMEKFSGHSSKSSALATAVRVHSLSKSIRWSLLGCTISLDITIFLLQLSFIPTITLLITVGTVYGVRKLAGMVYSNSKKIHNHEGRIENFEKDN